MIRILHVMDTLYQKSGIANVVMNYYRNIDRKKIQFDFLITDNNEHTYISEVKSYGGNIYFMPRLGIKNTINFIKYLNEFFYKNGHKYVAVHSHFNQIDCFIFPIAKRNGIRECISHSHNTKYSDKKIRSIRNAIMCLPIKKQATRWVACSEDAGVFLFGREFENSPKSLVINNAIECEKYRYDYHLRVRKRREFNLEDKFVIGHIGRFNEQKNHKFLINIFKEINKLYDNAVLILIGDGPLYNEVLYQIRKYNLEDKVLVLGQRSDIEEMVQIFDIMIFPSIFEGLGIALIEAQAADLPCVYSDNIPDVVNILESNEIHSLNDSYSIWANSALKYRFHRREVDAVNKVKRAGFDISVEAKKIMQFYLSL